MGIPHIPEVEDADIAAAEEAIGVVLPLEFAALARHCDAATPEVGAFTYGERATCISEFFAVRGEDWSIVGAYCDRPPDMNSSLVPFARDPGDDLICFDFRASGAPSVVIYHHEDGTVAFVALSFVEFIDGLSV